MKVLVHRPPPPSPSFDLLGLTPKQVTLIYRMIGKINCEDAAKLIGAEKGDQTAYELYKQLESLASVVGPVPNPGQCLRLSL